MTRLAKRVDEETNGTAPETTETHLPANEQEMLEQVMNLLHENGYDLKLSLQVGTLQLRQITMDDGTPVHPVATIIRKQGRA